MVVHNITLSFTDGQTRSLAVEHGGNLLETALANDIELLYQCKTGSCNTCTCTSRQGDLRVEANTSVALLPSEIAAGQRLACLTNVYSDGVVEFPYSTAKLDREAPDTFHAEITEIEQLNDSVVYLKLESEAVPEFDAGAYFAIEVPGQSVNRAYSPSSVPGEDSSLEFLIRLQPGGRMSDFLSHTAAIGDVMSVEGPFGEFTWNNTKAPVVFVAGGTGLAPILSMLRTIAEERRHREKILLCFGVNRYEELFLEDELEFLQEMMPRLEVRIAVVEPNDNWTGATGHVTDLITADDVTSETQAFLCGPPPMVTAATERLTSFGVDDGSILFERFAAS